MQRKLLWKPLPQVITNALTREGLTTEKWKGKPMMIVFFDTDGDPAGEVIEQLNKLKQTFDKEVFFAAISDRSRTDVDLHVARQRFDFYLVPDAIDVYENLEMESGYTKLIIDNSGIIVRIETGTYVKEVESENRQPGEQSDFQIQTFQRYSEILDKLLKEN